MNWKTFLVTHGADFSNTELPVFGDARQEIVGLATKTQLVALEHLAIVRVSGDDALTFLQGQLTNDINLLGDNKIQLSGYCNPKGRLLAQFIVMPEQNDYLLVMPRMLVEKTVNRLRMFVLRSKVELKTEDDDLLCLGIAGNDVESSLPDLAGKLPNDDYQLVAIDDYLLAKLPGIPTRYLAVMPASKAIKLCEEHAEHTGLAGPAVWNWLDIHAGIPTVLPETVEEFVPQMVNLDLIDGVNFKKGCYTGQEIVARMHYLGKAKRRMFRLYMEDESAPEPGTDIFDGKGDMQSVGKVVLSSPSADKGIDLLAVLQLAHSQSDELHLGEPGGPVLTMMPLPYPVDS